MTKTTQLNVEVKMTLTLTIITAISLILATIFVAPTLAFAQGGGEDSGGNNNKDDQKKTTTNNDDSKTTQNDDIHCSDGACAPTHHSIGPCGGPVMCARRFNGDSGTSNSNSNDNNNNINNDINTINGLFRSPQGQSNTASQQHNMAPVPIAGYNATFYNQTMPYCFAVSTGACYDSNSQTVIP